MNSTHFILTNRCTVIMCQFITQSTKIRFSCNVLLCGCRVNNWFGVVCLATCIFKVLRRISCTSSICRCTCSKIFSCSCLTITFTIHFNCTLGFTFLKTSGSKPSVRCIYEECIWKMFLHTA